MAIPDRSPDKYGFIGFDLDQELQKRRQIPSEAKSMESIPQNIISEQESQLKQVDPILTISQKPIRHYGVPYLMLEQALGLEVWSTSYILEKELAKSNPRIDLHPHASKLSSKDAVRLLKFLIENDYAEGVEMSEPNKAGQVQVRKPLTDSDHRYMSKIGGQQEITFTIDLNS